MTLLHTLKITDGTTEIDLLSKHQLYGWHLNDATLNFPTFKGDGSWSDPVTNNGRQLENYTLTNANDVYELNLKAATSDSFDLRLSTMRSLLLQAANYWVNGIESPVWLEVRGINEGVTRYAIIKNAILDGEGSHWGGSFFQPNCEPTMMFTLAIERNMWTKYPPGNSESLCLSSTQLIDTTTDVRYIVERNTANAPSIFSTNSWFDTMFDNDLAITWGGYFPPLSRDDTIFLTQDAPAPFTFTYSGTRITITYSRATEDYYVVFNVIPELTQTYVYMDFIWDATNTSFTAYMNGIQLDKRYEIIGSGALDATHNTFIMLSGWNQITMEYLRFDSNAVPIGDARTTTGEVAILCTEGGGTTCANSGTLGSTANMTFPSTPLWHARNITSLIGYGKDICNANATHIANVELPIPITHIFSYDSSGPTWSSNLMDSTPPYELVSFAPATGDYLYVGSTIGRFTHIVFNLNPGAVAIDNNGSRDIWNLWEISRGASVWANFASLGGYDTTRSLAASGVGNVSGFTGNQTTSTSWTLDTVNGVQAYWLRLPLYSDTWSGTWIPPVQADYQVYSGTAHVNVPSYNGNSAGLSAITFDGDSLALRQRDNFTCLQRINEIVCGFRSNSRGLNFVSDLSVEDTLLPTNISSVSGFSAVANATAPGGYCVKKTVGSTADFALMQWVISDELTQEYAGTYKIYARISTTGEGVSSGNWLGSTTGRLTASVHMGADTVSVTDNTQLLSTVIGRDVLTGGTGGTYFVLYEIGTIRIPYTGSYNTKSDITLEIGFRQNFDGAVGDALYISDAILIPTDEYAFFTVGADIESTLGQFGHNLALGYMIDTDGANDIDMHTRKSLLIDAVTDLQRGNVSYEFINSNWPIDYGSSLYRLRDGITGVWQFDSATSVAIPNVDGGGRLFFCFPNYQYASALQITTSVNPVYFSLGDTD